MGEETPETCWATHKRQVINLWNCCILLVDLFESYDDARTCERQMRQDHLEIFKPWAGGKPIVNSQRLNSLTNIYLFENITELKFLLLFLSLNVFLFIVGVEAFCCTWSHSMTYTHTYTVGFLWTRDRPVAEAATCTTHNVHTRQKSMPRWDSKPQSRSLSNSMEHNPSSVADSSTAIGHIPHVLYLS